MPLRLVGGVVVQNDGEVIEADCRRRAVQVDHTVRFVVRLALRHHDAVVARATAAVLLGHGRSKFVGELATPTRALQFAFDLAVGEDAHHLVSGVRVASARAADEPYWDAQKLSEAGVLAVLRYAPLLSTASCRASQQCSSALACMRMQQSG